MSTITDTYKVPGSLLDPKAQMTKTWMAKELTGWGTSGNITNN
jgi:hypothetical protein